jgi:hypothetical protein
MRETTLLPGDIYGQRIEMNSVMAASRALEELARHMTSDAHELLPDGSVKDVPSGELGLKDKVLIKPGEKVPADGIIVAGESSVDEVFMGKDYVPGFGLVLVVNVVIRNRQDRPVAEQLPDYSQRNTLYWRSKDGN